MSELMRRLLGFGGYLEQAAGDDGLDGGSAGGESDGDAGETDGQDGADDADQESGEVVITIGEQPTEEDSEEHQQAPQWVKDLRKSHRELAKRNRELEDAIRAKDAPPATLKVGEKPTLEGCDFDAPKFEEELSAWYERKRQADEEARKIDQAKQAEQNAWNERLQSYGKAKDALKVKDFDEAEEAVKLSLSTIQQGVILQGAENPALVVYALGKNPTKAKELAAISDPVKYAFAIAKLETQLKVTNRKAPPPEKAVSGNGSVSGTVDSQLERLRAEAERTGNYTKVTQYKQQLRRKSA